MIQVSEVATNTISNITPEPEQQHMYNHHNLHDAQYSADQQILHPYQQPTLPIPDLEPKFQPPQTNTGPFDLEAMYWNNFHPAGNGYQAPQWFPPSNEGQTISITAPFFSQTLGIHVTKYEK